MVQGIPYVHWKINGTNEDYNNVDINYLWATVVEASKGPINTPILCASNNDVLRLFGVDLSAYFAQGAQYLIVVRAGAQTETHQFGYATKSITNSEDFEYQKIVQPYYVKQGDIYSFSSYADENGEHLYANGQVELTGVIDGESTQIIVKSQDAFQDQGFVDTKFFIQSDAQVGDTLYTLYESTEQNTKGALVPNIYIKINSHDSDSLDNGLKKYVLDGEGNRIYVHSLPNNSSLYQKCDEKTGELDTTDTTVYPVNEVIDDKTAETVLIKTGTPLIELKAKYPGAFNATLVLYKNLTYSGYNITLTEEGAGYVTINNVLNLQNIVNTINNAGLSIVASLTEAGQKVVDATNTKPVTSEYPYSNAVIGQVLAKEDGTRYKIALTHIEDDIVFNGGSNGEWNNATNRISDAYTVLAHREALDTLQTIRLAGVFCLYGEDEIQREYLIHGQNDNDDYHGMNSNLVCKWREILIGANEYDREDVWNLKTKSQSINNEYVIFLGQGLIENGRQLLPFECTPYIAGLRATLFYGDAIFGGQTKKQILPSKPNLSLKIAPLFTYEDEKTMLVWEPTVYQDLNENGVLTFTNEYGGLTLLDGVTTAQTNDYKSSEGVVNILKYIQNNVQSICLGYIGRNINTDSESALKVAIRTFLETMVQDATLINLPDEELDAYDVDVKMTARNTQLIGKIYVYLKVTPVYALRQIEVEMTVQ